MKNPVQDTLEKSFTMTDAMVDKFWDMWLVGMGSVTWTQEQTENMIKKYLEQRKLAREESSKVVDEMMEQAKKNQQQFKNMIQEAVKSAMENIDIPAYTYMGDLQKKVNDLSSKVDKL